MPECNPTKLIFYANSFIAFIFACVLMAVGTYAIREQIITDVTLPSGVTALGVFIFLMQFFGVVAICKENSQHKLSLSIYVILQVLFVVVLLFVGIAVLTAEKKADQYITDAWDGLANNGRIVTQNAWTCCGFHNFNDTLRGDPCSIQSIAGERPCQPVLSSWFEKVFKQAGGCAIAFAVLMLVSVGIAVFYLRRTRTLYASHVFYSQPTTSAPVSYVTPLLGDVDGY